MTTFDFSGLTTAQADLLTRQGWEPGRGRQPRPQVVAKLVHRGLLVERPVRILAAVVTAYDAPVEVLAAWQAHRCEQDRTRAR